MRNSHLYVSLSRTAVGLLVDAGFLLCWRFLPGRLSQQWALAGQLSAMVLLSLLVWALLSTCSYFTVSAIQAHGLEGLSSITATLAILVVGVMTSRFYIPSPRGTKRVTLLVLVLRGIFAGKPKGPVLRGAPPFFTGFLLPFQVSPSLSLSWWAPLQM
jgi:hypothetical protein